ncbi:MAG: hypothetical protein KF812_00840 [Fimbriimonadaceae bacterium]|nr:hypothetical protein [Fimbriimonadaceae bacterium]
MTVKNQNDLIVAIVAGVLGLTAIGVSYGTARKPNPPATPQAIVTAPAEAPPGAVVYANGTGTSAQGGFGQGGPTGGAPIGGAGARPGQPSNIPQRPSIAAQ